MNKIGSKNLLVVIFSVLAGVLIVWANWILVDPFHIRALSTPLRFTITALAGLGLGWLIYHALIAILPGLSASPQKKRQRPISKNRVPCEAGRQGWSWSLGSFSSSPFR